MTSSDKCGSKPARTNEVLPQPDGPYITPTDTVFGGRPVQPLFKLVNHQQQFCVAANTVSAADLGDKLRQTQSR